METMNTDGAHGVTLPTIPIEQGNEFLEVRQSAIHGTGGYARKDIPAGTRIIEYVGERIDKVESDKRCEAENAYIFTLDEDCDLDGDIAWNPARFINHSCAPNCEAEWDESRIYINALGDLKQGEELTFNYGFDMEEYHEHVCQCRIPRWVCALCDFVLQIRSRVGPWTSARPLTSSFANTGSTFQKFEPDSPPDGN